MVIPRVRYEGANYLAVGVTTGCPILRTVDPEIPRSVVVGIGKYAFQEL
jgi:hypothetical protein